MPGPTRRARRWVPPKPGVMPRPTSGWPKIACSAQIRKSQLIASSQPPPSAKPLTAAMTGSGKVSIMRKMSLPFLPKASPPCASMPDIAAISAPATKDFSPAPVTMTQRTVSVSMPSKVAFKSSSTSAFSAFSAFSRSMVTTATAPLVSYFTYPICLASSEKSTEGLRACEDPPITLSCTAQQSLRSPVRRRCRA